jgi:ATP-binding protein involved in chromosome partitioning
VIWRAPMVMGALQQMLSEVALGKLHRHAARHGQCAIDDGPAGAARTHKGVNIFNSRRSLRREDMSYFLCLPLRGRSETLSHLGARQKVERLGTEFHGDVPLDLKARETSDGRSPITVSEPDNPQVLVFCHIAGRICEKVTGAHAEQRATRIVIH